MGIVSEHRILTYDTPLQPDDIEPGNVLLIGGQPRTIREVRPVASSAVLPTFTPTLVVECGHGESQLFYVLTCGTCGQVRAFPGLGPISEWYSLSHGNTFHLYCGAECAITGLLVPAREAMGL